MNPGRELDALVAEKVMGLKPKKFFHIRYYIDRENEGKEWLKKYSTNLNDAFEVLAFLHSQGIAFCIEQAPSANTTTVHIVPRQEHRQTSVIRFIEDMEKISYKSKSVAHAICLAALNAVGVEV